MASPTELLEHTIQRVDGEERIPMALDGAREVPRPSRPVIGVRRTRSAEIRVCAEAVRRLWRCPRSVYRLHIHILAAHVIAGREANESDLVAIVAVYRAVTDDVALRAE